MKYFILLLILISASNPFSETYAQPVLCEQFADTTFPPAGWTLQFSGAQYWSRVSISAFNNGLGSVRYNMWSAPAGADQSLITPVFQPTGAGDSLILDMSYAPYPQNPPYDQDSLIILASTSGGSAYISVRRMGPAEMKSCINCNQTVWTKRTFWLPAGTNRIQFLGRSQFGNDLFLDSICILNSALGIENITSVSLSYSLEQNYPNPFNPSTNIKFTIPRSGVVKLVISDILGRKVSEPVNEFMQAGSYNVDFDGAALSSGIYFYAIQSGGFTMTKKMLLIK